MKNYKIAISGKAKTGKNTVAALLADNIYSEYNISAKIVAISDPMKHIISIMMPEANKECLYGPSELRSNIILDKYKDKNGKPLTYRQALLDIGSYGRSYDDNMWLNILNMDANNFKNNGAYLVSDVRFLIEFNYLKNAGFYMVRVKRNNISVINDPSETEQDKIPDSEFDYIINNNSTIEELSNEVVLIINSSKNKQNQ